MGRDNFLQSEYLFARVNAAGEALRLCLLEKMDKEIPLKSHLNIPDRNSLRIPVRPKPQVEKRATCIDGVQIGRIIQGKAPPKNYFPGIFWEVLIF